jgi:hypothetical protein
MLTYPLIVVDPILRVRLSSPDQKTTATIERRCGRHDLQTDPAADIASEADA